MSSNITSLTQTYAGHQDEEAEALITEEETFEEQKNQNRIKANLLGERA